MTREELESRIDEIYEEVLAFRRKLHAYPELGMEERRTTEWIAEVLEKYQIRCERLSPSGVLAYIGKPPYERALRADVDALRVKEETKLDYASKREGYMHACGHDMHTAALLYAGILLKEREEELKRGIILVFQPSEENCKGANFILETGKLEQVQEIFGLHVFTDILAGKISLEAGERMARTDKFEIRIEGCGGHAAKPQQCVDATVAAAATVLQLQSIVSRELNPIESAVLSVGSFHSGSAYNIISKEAVLSGTVRSFSDESAIKILDSIERIAKHTAAAYRASAKLNFEIAAHPPLINDGGFVDKIKQFSMPYFEKEDWIIADKMMLGEDFSNYQDKMRACFAFVGAGRADSYPNHHSRFAPEEEVLKTCIKLHICAAFA